MWKRLVLWTVVILLATGSYVYREISIETQWRAHMANSDCRLFESYPKEVAYIIPQETGGAVVSPMYKKSYICPLSNGNTYMLLTK